MGTFFLNRKLSNICGNILIAVNKNGEDIRLTSGLSKSSLSDHQYKHIKINPDGDYANDIHKIFNSTERNILFSGDDYEKHDGKIIVTLVINESIPDRFTIMTKNDSDIKNEHTIKHSFDLSENSKLGKYIRTHLSNTKINYNPIYIDFENKYVSVNGIDISSGNIVSVNDRYNTISNEYVSGLFSYKNIIPSTIFQFMFEVDDLLEDDYWFFNDDIKLGSFLADNFDDNFVPTVYSAIVNKGIHNVNFFDGIILNEDNDIPYYYCKCDNKISSSTPIIDNIITINDDLLSKFIPSDDIELLPIKDYTRRIVIKLNNSSEQSDNIHFLLKKSRISLIADSLPNKPDFKKTDNERFVFNPSGTIEEQLISIENAFNYEVESKHSYIAKAYGEYLVISSTNEFLPFEIIGIITDLDITIIDDTELPIKTNLITGVVSLNDANDIMGSYIKSKIGYHKITTRIPYVQPEIIDNEYQLVDLHTKMVIGAENDYNGDIDNIRVWDREKIEYGVMSVYPLSDMLSDIITNSTIVDYYYGKYNSQTSLVVGEEYLVVGDTQEKIINHDGIEYGVSSSITLLDEFVATTTDFTVVSGNPKIYSKKYYNDNEVIEFRNNIIPTIEEPIIVSNNINWSIKDCLSSTNDFMNLLYSSIPDFDIKENDVNLHTHSWYNISTIINSENFDDTKYKNSSYDYFLEYFNDDYSIIKLNNDFGISETIFKGVKLNFSSEYDGYKFSTLLNILDLSDTYQTQKKPIDINILKNDEYKSIIIKIDLSVSDWKSFDNNNNLSVDYAYLHMMSGIKKFINNSLIGGDTFYFPQIPNLTFEDGIGNITDSFNGIKIQNTYKLIPETDSIGFNGNILTVSNWVKQEGSDFVGLIGINRLNSSIISTFINDASSGYWKQGESLKFTVNNNTITFLDNQIYVLAINGTVVDSILPFNYLKGFEDLSNYEWYQVSNAEKCYDSIKKIISFSNIKDVILDNNEDIISELDSIKFVRPNETHNCYSDKYVISNKNISDIGGDIVIDNWYTHYKTWEEEIDNNWIDINQNVRLGFVLNKKININKL